MSSSGVLNQPPQDAAKRQFYGRVRIKDTNAASHDNTVSKQDNQYPSRKDYRRTSITQNAPTKDTKKLGTFTGVFIPTTLNVLSILMFLRFGFIIGQAGILGTLALLVLSFSIDLLTTLSISAISTNGTVRGGGAYYMISRSLGPEFGGSIGVVFYIGQILNT